MDLFGLARGIDQLDAAGDGAELQEPFPDRSQSHFKLLMFFFLDSALPGAGVRLRIVLR